MNWKSDIIYRMKFLVSVILIIGLFVGGIVFVGSMQKKQAISSSDINLVASFYPLEYFASQIGGSTVKVHSLVPSGVEPHDYELTPTDLQTLSSANILLVNGNGFEPWGERVIKDFPSMGKELLIASKIASDSGTTSQLAIDPHFWLDPLLATKISAAITSVYQKLDPAHAQEYQSRNLQLITKLNKLDSDYRSGLAHCTQRTIVTSHKAFGHLAARYALTQVPISGLSPEEEPSPAQMAQIVTTIRSLGIKSVYTESLVSPKLAQTIAKETGAEVLVLDPIESMSSDAQTKGEDYFSRMYENLMMLRKGLNCP